MAYTFEDAALSAAILGILFYADPHDERSADAFAFALNPDSADAWPCTEGTLAQRVNDAFALMQENASTQQNSLNETLHESYARLLIGPNPLPAPPWGSVYTDRESVIFGNKTLDVRDWMRANGVKMNLGSREPEDHFGLMLTMFSWAARNGVSEAELRVFLEQHLLPWAPRFLELFRAGAQGTFYEGLANLAAATLEQWTQAFELQPVTCRLYR